MGLYGIMIMVILQYQWNIYGISTEYLWNIYAVSMEYLWNIYGIMIDVGKTMP